VIIDQLNRGELSNLKEVDEEESNGDPKDEASGDQKAKPGREAEIVFTFRFGIGVVTWVHPPAQNCLIAHRHSLDWVRGAYYVRPDRIREA